MPSKLSQAYKLASLGVISLVAYSYAGFSLLAPGGAVLPRVPVAYAHVNEKQSLSIEQFKAQVDQYSRDNMMVVLLRRDACAVCPGVQTALVDARAYLQKKVQRGFAVYELNAEQNPDVAALLRQRDPQADARLHVFYNGEKIFESAGISDNPRHLAEALEMVQALAEGQVSAYDKYQPAQVFPAPAGL